MRNDCNDGFGLDAFNRALSCLLLISDFSVSGFAGGLGLGLSQLRSPRLRPSGLSDCRRRLLCSQQSCFGVTSFFLFCPLLSGAAFSGRRAVDLRSTYVALSGTGFGPFPFPAFA